MPRDDDQELAWTYFAALLWTLAVLNVLNQFLHLSGRHP